MNQQNFTNTSKGYLFAILSSIFFGSSGLFVKLAQKTELSSIDILTLQYMIAVPVLWIISFIKYKHQLKISKRILFKLLILGLFLTPIVNLCYYESFQYLNISVATILFYTYPILIALYSFLFLKKKPNKIVGISLALSFMGCALVVNIFQANTSISMLGFLYCIGASFFYAIFTLLIETLENKIPPILLTTYISTFALLSFIFYHVPSHSFNGGFNRFQIGITILLTFICQVPPMVLLYAAIQYIGAVKTSIIANIEIPTAAILGYIFYDEILSFSQLFGICFVISGILLLKNNQYISRMILHAMQQPYKESK